MSEILNHLKEQMKVSNMNLEYNFPSKFTTPISGRPSLVYVLYRILASCYLCAMTMYSYLESGAYSKWFIYLTHWSFSVLTIGSVVSTILAVKAYLQRLHCKTANFRHAEIFEDVEDVVMPGYIKVIWVLQNIGFNSAIIVTTMYWGAVYQPSIGISLLNTSTHISNTMYVLLDFCIVGMPVRLLHVWHSAVYFLSYGAFSYVYYLCGGTNEIGQSYVYTILDYKSHPTAAFFMIVGTAASVCLVHCCYYGLACCRDSLLVAKLYNIRLNSENSPSFEKLTPVNV